MSLWVPQVWKKTGHICALLYFAIDRPPHWVGPMVHGWFWVKEDHIRHENLVPDCRPEQWMRVFFLQYSWLNSWDQQQRWDRLLGHQQKLVSGSARQCWVRSCAGSCIWPLHASCLSICIMWIVFIPEAVRMLRSCQGCWHQSSDAAQLGQGATSMQSPLQNWADP